MSVLRLMFGVGRLCLPGLDRSFLSGITCAMITDDELRAAALAVAPKAYAPYSRFYVGAAALFDNGKIYRGVNVENKSYGLTICAERAAIFQGIADGQKKLLRIAICCLARDAMPCGACLEVLTEFGRPDTKILVGDHAEYKLSELFPHPFEL
jgi:cytidine deaminase